MGVGLVLASLSGAWAVPHRETPSVLGVCPPFHLRDEAGDIIDPVHRVNDTVPYSPRQTCGAEGCHDYARITEGYHFTQGKGEEVPADLAERIGWVSAPGNYGGAWCSPAPLYRYLAPQHNDTPQTIDMTSFTFIEAGCGNCHPGGGPLEFDRSGRRYDRHMDDPDSGLISGGENGLDGDYFRARWSETGVIEADCLLCHYPGYNFAARRQQIAALNYRWAASAGAGFASVEGSVKAGQTPRVTYDPSRFNPDGTVSPHIVLSPRNETCLECHAQPGWKKRGADYRGRTDVHLRAGLRCTDCHQAGSRADDPRIRGREVHQIGKGDDPGGRVRDDLDSTVRNCDSCHSKGLMGAPIARHQGLPPLHLDRIACQTCHIPERSVKPIQVQASDVVSPGAKIPGKGKQLWTFYGPDMKYRNHYGYLEMMGYDDKPTEPFKPALAVYKGKIFPVNRVHSTWPGIEIEGRSALMQPRMSDIREMWEAHSKDPAAYPTLAQITDDNGDGVIEVNRPQEIDALIAAVTSLLANLNYPLQGRRVVWVMNDRVYTNGTEYRMIEKKAWEASPYANTHKYSHEVYPASAALGAGGCGDCHSPDSDFFFAQVPTLPFDSEKALPVTVAQHEILGYFGVPRQYQGAPGLTATYFKALAAVVLFGLTVHIVLDFLARRRKKRPAESSRPGFLEPRFNTHFLAQHLLLALSVLTLVVSAASLFSLRYPGSLWAASVSAAVGGIEFWRQIHRMGAVLLILVALHHLVYSLIHPEGRRDFVLMIPRRKDFGDLGRNLGWFLGLRAQPPKFGRFSYFEKFDYWAVFWGCAIMIGTGLGMWFPDAVRRLLPSAGLAFFDSLKEAHAHEAILAALALGIWHFYNVHLRPGRFPGSWTWLTGYAPPGEEERRIEEPRHPDAPVPSGTAQIQSPDPGMTG